MTENTLTDTAAKVVKDTPAASASAGARKGLDLAGVLLAMLMAGLREEEFNGTKPLTREEVAACFKPRD